jgi:hypothetical protein
MASTTGRTLELLLVHQVTSESRNSVPEADWDIAMAEITAHLLTPYVALSHCPSRATSRSIALVCCGVTILSAALVAIDEGRIAVWSDDAPGDTTGVGRPRVPTSGSKNRL